MSGDPVIGSPLLSFALRTISCRQTFGPGLVQFENRTQTPASVAGFARAVAVTSLTIVSRR